MKLSLACIKMIHASDSNFVAAKISVSERLKRWAKFADDMNKKYPMCGSQHFVKKLSNLETIMQNASGPCFSQNQINDIERFAHFLSSNRCFIDKYFIHAGFISKLHQFWLLRKSILGTSGKTEDIILWRLEEKSPMQEKIKALVFSLQTTSRVQNLTGGIVEEVLTQQPNMLTITSILLALLVRVQAHEYEIGKMLEKAERYINLNFDIQEMCSVDKKVQKGTEWRSDVRAIRDAISHAHFDITYNNKQFQIHINNTEKGYNYDKVFSGDSLLLFYQDYERLTLVQMLLLNTALLSDFLSKELMK
jgi:hypothetical protein